MKYKNHRWTWEKYNGKIPKGFQIHHKDGNKRNNSIDNLELLNPKEHSAKHLHIAWNKGKNGLQNHTELTKKKISKTMKKTGIRPPSHKGIPHTEKAKNKIGKANKGKVHSEDFKKIRSEIQKNLWKNPEYRKRMIESHKR